jgi:uncharacterized protein (TIGR03000 family)
MPLPPDPPGLEKRCGSFEKLFRGEYALENNDWGATQLPGYQYAQCVYASPDGDPAPRYAWAWDDPEQPPEGVRGYPEIIFGKKPWADATTSPALPRVLAPPFSLRANYTAHVNASGRYNLAFDLWLTRNGGAGVADITHEIMFWVLNQGATPGGGYVRDLTLADGRTCALWYGDDVGGHPYYAFVFQAPVLTGAIEFGYYLNYLRHDLPEADLRLPAGLFVASVELGNEVWFGTGTTTLDHYQVTVGDALEIPPVPVATAPEVPAEPPPAPEPPVINAPTPAVPAPVPQPTEPATPTALAFDFEIDPSRAYIVLDVPAGARVSINDNPMASTSAKRSFRSPPIDSGVDYVYRVSLVIDAPGRHIEEWRDVRVRAGELVSLSFLYLQGDGG